MVNNLVKTDNGEVIGHTSDHSLPNILQKRTQSFPILHFLLFTTKTECVLNSFSVYTELTISPASVGKYLMHLGKFGVI